MLLIIMIFYGIHICDISTGEKINYKKKCVIVFMAYLRWKLKRAYLTKCCSSSIHYPSFNFSYFQLLQNHTSIFNQTLLWWRGFKRVHYPCGNGMRGEGVWLIFSSRTTWPEKQNLSWKIPQMHKQLS